MLPGHVFFIQKVAGGQDGRFGAKKHYLRTEEPGGLPTQVFLPPQFFVKAPEAHLRTHRPGSQDVSTEIQALRLHLGVAGAAVVWEGWEVGAALEDLHVMDQGFIPACDHWLILKEEGERCDTPSSAALHAILAGRSKSSILTL